MAGPAVLPPFSFWAASISCLLISASSMAFFLASASRAFFSASAFLMRSSSSLFFLASSFSCSALISFLLLCAALIPPGVDVFLELLVELVLVHASLPLGERLITLGRGGGGVGHTIVIHPDTVFYVASSLYTDPDIVSLCPP